MPGKPAMFTVTVKISSKYIASGSPVFSPKANAGFGVVVAQHPAVDVFMSADIAFAREVHDAGLATGVPRVYAIGRLAAWSARIHRRPSFLATQPPGFTPPD